MIKIGDKVAVLDDDITGIVVKINDATITIETPDGFDMAFTLKELVKIDSSELSKHVFAKDSLDKVISDKESTKRQQPTRAKKR